MGLPASTFRLTAQWDTYERNLPSGISLRRIRGIAYYHISDLYAWPRRFIPCGAYEGRTSWTFYQNRATSSPTRCMPITRPRAPRFSRLAYILGIQLNLPHSCGWKHLITLSTLSPRTRTEAHPRQFTFRRYDRLGP